MVHGLRDGAESAGVPAPWTRDSVRKPNQEFMGKKIIFLFELYSHLVAGGEDGTNSAWFAASPAEPEMTWHKTGKGYIST